MTSNNPKQEKKLKPFSKIIQICPDCGQFDVYEDDGHACDREYQEYLRNSNDY